VEKKACELCGREVEPRAMEKHHIVPTEVREQAGIRRAKIVRLCSDCYAELHKWYSAKVLDSTYDTKMKRFRSKSPPEMVKEYEAAYRVFAKYRRGINKGLSGGLNSSTNI